MVHAALAGILVLQCLVRQSGGLALSLCRGGGGCAEQYWTILEGNIIGVVRTFGITQFHGHVHGNHVALLPVALQSHIAAPAFCYWFPVGSAELLLFAVHRERVVAGSPPRVTYGNGVASCLVHGDGRPGGVGVSGLLGELKAGIVESARCKQVYVNHAVAIVRVDKVPVFAVVLHTCAHAAPHGLVNLRVDAVTLRAQCGEVHVAAGGGVLGRQDVVPHGVFVEVGIAGIMCAVG